MGAGLVSIFRKDPTCGSCGRGYPKGSTCKACAAVVRKQVSTAARKGVNLAPHSCPVKGCGHMVRGGVCPSPDH